MRSANLLVVGQSRTHRIFFVGMAVVLAAISMLVVQRPPTESYPVALFILAIFAVVGLHIFTSRLELDGPILSALRYGRKLWSVDVRHARFRDTEDDIRWLVIEVFDQGRKVGSIHEIYFDPSAFRELWAEIGKA